MKSPVKLFVAILAATIMSFAATANAQAPAAAPAPAAAAPADAASEEEEAPKPKDVRIIDIIYGDSLLNLTIWLLLFATSAACIGLIVDAVISIKAEKIMPRELAESVREALEHGDLGAALQACEDQPCPLANILSAGLNNVSNGYSVVMDSVTSASSIEAEKLMQRVNLLNLVGALAPMLGLMGTVVGMVMAFAALANTSGAEKAQVLAVNISIALYTTLYGLLVSVPAIVGFTFIRNHANKLILTMEVLTYDLIRVLKDAEVVAEGE